MDDSSFGLAKFDQPAVYRPVLRERLFGRLDARPVPGAVWISGPPGSGKTALASSYVQARGLPVAWFTCDAGDADPATLVHYLGVLGHRCAPSTADPFPALTAEHLPDLAGYLRRFLRHFYAQLAPGTVVVLDNVQELEGEAAAVFLRTALAEMPAGRSMLALSRGDPPAALTRFAAEGRLSALGWSDLRLDAAEAGQLAQGRGIPAPQQVETTLAQVDGWAAGFVLLLASASPDTASAVSAAGSRGSRQAVFDYLVAEVLDALEPRARAHLLRVALFTEFTAALLRDLTEDPEAEATVVRMHRQRYFTDRSEGPVPVYRFHALFREALLAEFEENIPAAERDALRRRAAELLSRAGHAEAALDLFLSANDHASAAASLLGLAAQLDATGQWRRLQDLLVRLPAAHVAADPWLSYWRAQSLLPSAPQDALDAFELAYTGFGADSQTEGRLRSAIGALTALIWAARDYRPMDVWLQRAEAVLDTGSAVPTPVPLLAAWSVYLLSLLCRGQVRNAREAAKILCNALDTGSVPAAAAYAIAGPLVNYAHSAADVDLTQWITQRVAACGDRLAVPGTVEAIWLFHRGIVALVGNAFPEAIDLLTRAADRAEECGAEGPRWLSHVFRAYSHLGAGDVAAAAADLDRAGDGAVADNFMQARFWEDKGRALLAAHEGDFVEGLARARLAVADVDRYGNMQMFITIRSDCAPIAVAAGELGLAAQWIQQAEAAAAGSLYCSCNAALRAGRAYLALATGDVTAARQRFAEALGIARNPGMQGQLRWVGPGLPALFALALADGTETGLVKQLIRDWRVASPPDRPESWPWPVRIRTFGAMRIELNDAPVPTDGKAHHRLMEVLAVLLAHGAAGVPADTLADAVWPDADGDAARASLKTALHRLRRFLDRDDAVRTHDGAVSLEPSVCWADCVEFERGTAESAAASAFESLERAIGLYRAPFLPARAAPYIVTKREHLRARYVRAVQALASRLAERGDGAGAIALLQRAGEIEPAAEALHHRLIAELLRAGRRAEAQDALHACEGMLRRHTGRGVSEDTRALLKEADTMVRARS